MNDRVSRFRPLIGACIGLVVCFLSCGWVITSISRVKEGGPRIKCMNNLKQIGNAIQNYADVHGHYPSGTISHPIAGPGHRLSWTISLLPFLDHETACKRFQLDLPAGTEANLQAGRTIELPVFRCGAFEDSLIKGISSYAGITGIGHDSGTLPIGDLRAGFFGYDRKYHTDDLKKGAGQTVSVVEIRNGLGPWFVGDQSTLRFVDPTTAPYVRKDGPFGLNHPKSMYSLFADCHVEPIRDDVKNQYFEMLMTVAGPKPPE